jgi:hypothetical protein
MTTQPGPILRRWFGQWDPGVFLLLLLPLGLLCLNSNWIFNYPGWADQWIYFGNHESLWRKLKLFRDSYRATRLSWDLPGAICYTLVPPLAARLLLHLGFYYAAVFSFYAVAKGLLGSRTALLCAVMMGSYPLFLASLGWDYVDGACQTYFLLTLFCALKGAEGPHHKKFLVLAGVFFAAGVYAYPLALVFGPVIGGLFLLRNARDRQVSLVSAMQLFSAGLFGVTLVFCLVFVWATNRFFFFLPSLKFTAGFVQMKEVNVLPNGWLWVAYWAVLPVAVAGASAVGAVRNLLCLSSLNDSERAGLFFQLAYCGLFLVSMTCLVCLRVPCLAVTFYTSFLTPPLFLALAGLIRPVVERMHGAALGKLLSGVSLLALVPFVPGLLPSLASLVTPAMIWSLGAVVGGLLLTTLVSQSRWLASSCILTATVVSGLSCLAFPLVFAGRDALPNRDVHLAFARSHKYLREIWPRQSYRFWFPANDPLTRSEVYVSLALSTNVGNFVVVNDKFPNHGTYLTNGHDFVMEPGTRVVVLSNENDTLSRTNTSLRPLGLVATQVAEKHVCEGQVAYTMTFLEVDKIRAVPETSQTSELPRGVGPVSPVRRVAISEPQ